jgi:hypothetical protein
MQVVLESGHIFGSSRRQETSRRNYAYKDKILGEVAKLNKEIADLTSKLEEKA